MSLEHILLGYLREPATGYELNREFSDSGRHFWYAELSQIYPTLKRLEAKGWLRAQDAPSARGPGRRVYRLTARGQTALRRWLAGGPHIGRERLAYVAQAYFLDVLEDPDEALRVVRSMQRVWRDKLAYLETGEQELAEQFGADWSTYPAAVFHPYSALRNGIYQYRAKLAWCDETIARMDARRTSRPAEVGAVSGAERE